MESPIRILHLEDNLNDAALVQALLAEEGLVCEIVLVENQAEFATALEKQGFDLVLSDFSLPSYDGQSALLLAREMAPHTPYIFFSGTIGEESAIHALKEGATDYVLKGQPARLGAAVRRALREMQERAERRGLEEQFRQAQKMEAIGQLTGSIAHDFNNLLTVINGYAELMLKRIKEDDPLRSSLEPIKEAGARAAVLTRQLLAFSRRQVLEPKVLDLNAVVTNVDRLLQRLIGEDVQLVPILCSGLGRVKTDPGQIEQVIMNLAVNARDAMPEGGKLTVETANVELDEAYARQHVSVKPGPYVMLSVSDTGCGMDAETQKRIFEPFFTTKEPGRGTGLGLATVYGIVKQSGGNIWVYSEPGKGTTFKIYLPRVDEQAEAKEPMAASPVLRGSETVMLAEDEPMIRSLAKTILESNGYTVLEAQDSMEALRLCHMHYSSIHLLVTDVVMPGLSGRELAARLAIVHPETKVLYISGYTDDSVLRNRILSADLAFLQKPFSADAFLRKVREVLDRPSPAHGTKTNSPK